MDSYSLLVGGVSDAAPPSFSTEISAFASET